MIRSLYRLAVCLIAGLWIPAALSQAEPAMTGQELRYLRITSENQFEHVSLTGGETTSYVLPQRPACWALSSDGTRVALSRLDNPETLTIRQIQTDEVLLETDWQPDWRPCSMHFDTRTTIGFMAADSLASAGYYDITPEGLVPLDATPQTSDPMPDFPEELQPDVIPEFVLPAPDSSVFLYTRCVEQTFSDGSQQCPGGIAMTLYDATTQTIIADLPRAAIDISGYDIFEERSLPVQRKAEWSAGGRYLAYASVPETTAAQFDLHIRDMTTGDIIVPTFPNERVNYQSGLNWSPVAPHLLFWIEGRAGEDTAADNPEETRHAVIYDVASGEFVIADTPYDFSEDIIVHSVRWSADGQGLVFVDGRQNLIHMDTQTGSTTPIDTGVQRVLNRVAVP